MNYQDIHLEDKALWNQLQSAWEQDDYTAALNVLKNASLSDKQLNAAAINALTTELLRLQSQSDTSFKQDKIVVSTEPPADLTDGQVYFRLIGPTSEFGPDSYYIQATQKSGDSYIDLNPETFATNSMITSNTAQQYFKRQQISLDDAISAIGSTALSLRILGVRVYGPNNQLVENAQVIGLDGDPLTNENGIASGKLIQNQLTIIPPYIDWQSKTVDVTTTTDVIIDIHLEKYSENTILRFTESQTVIFSNDIKNVDVCCVGGGGGGANFAYGSYAAGRTSYIGSVPGGGGGGIANKTSIAPTALLSYSLTVGAGGQTRPSAYFSTGIAADTSGYDGGTSSFLSVSATGGGGGICKVLPGSYTTLTNGKAGISGCGDGGTAQEGTTVNKAGTSNTTISEFNDGTTFYSGGGGAGIYYSIGTKGIYAGGSPNGADGGYISGTTSPYTILNATEAGIGGGGGGAGCVNDNFYASPSPGGSGLIAIKLHYK